MKLSSTQKEIIYGLILGDAYLQKTGKHNARLRLEHSAKQKEYIEWKYTQLSNLFQRKPLYLKRIHPKTKNTNEYYRLQSHSSPWFGKLQRQWYNASGIKHMPVDLKRYLASPRTLAVWYMDDGYYDQRDKSAHIYLPRYEANDMKRVLAVFSKTFALAPRTYCRPDRKACQLNFTGNVMRQLMKVIRPYIIPSMTYKLPPDPVTTEGENM